MPVPARQALRRLLPYYHPYRVQVAIGLTAVVISAALSTYIPSLLQRGIDAVRAGADTVSLLRIAGVMLVTAVVGGSLRFTMRQLLNGVSRKIETDLRRDAFNRLLTLDPSWYARWRTGDLMARLTNDLGAVRMAAGPAVMYLLNTVAGGLFALVMMMRISPSLTGLALLPLVGLPVLTIRLGRLVHQRFEAVQAQFSDLSARAQENLSGVRVVRAYRQEDAEIRRFEGLGERYLEANMRLATLNGIMNPGFALLAGLGGAITVAVGGALLIDGRITVGGYVAFGIYLAMLTWPMIAIGWTTNLFQRGAASMSRVLETIDGVAAITSPSSARDLPPATGGRKIEFRNVSFHYPTDPRPVLRDISFVAPAGSTVAIVGATGSGKSALMDLVPRLFDPQQGTILVDDVPVRELSLDVLRAEIGYVPQESLLFSETVRENVAYGVADGSADVTAAAETAQLTATIAALPDGFETRLGERGINLSGGQKQRTALARALARDPRIVLLDDALSAVDTHTEAAILAGLRDALSRRTALLSSHRISTVRNADLILVLHQGAIVERGRHDELMARGGRYATLLRRQQLLDLIEEGESIGEDESGAPGPVIH